MECHATNLASVDTVTVVLLSVVPEAGIAAVSLAAVLAPERFLGSVA